jgi:hypothetical protein
LQAILDLLDRLTVHRARAVQKQIDREFSHDLRSLEAGSVQQAAGPVVGLVTQLFNVYRPMPTHP